MSTNNKKLQSTHNSSLIKNRYRKNFGTPLEATEIPYLIRIQTDSYRDFLQLDIEPEHRKNIGIQGVLVSHFPIISPNGEVIINFISYRIDPPKYSPIECKHFGITYGGALCITLEVNSLCNEEMTTQVHDIYIGEMPFMTANATFIINGSERIIVSQIHRSPGLFYEIMESESKTCIARIIPVRGVWIDFEIDERHQVFIIINKKQMYATTFLMAIVDAPDTNIKTAVLDLFARRIDLQKRGNKWLILDHSQINKDRLVFDIETSSTEYIIKRGAIFNQDSYVEDSLYISNETLSKLELHENVYLNEEVIGEFGEYLQISDQIPEGFTLSVINPADPSYIPILNSLRHGKCNSKSDALQKVYAILKPNEQAKKFPLQSSVEEMLFNEEFFNLSAVGRLKINEKFKTPEVKTNALRKDELFNIIRYLLDMHQGKCPEDDADSLEYRRVRSAGELVKNQFQQAISKFVRSIQEKLVGITPETKILELVNSRHVVTIMREFFATSQLSQIADQTNVLAELSHIRRLTSYGPGALSRNRPWAEVRHLHPTQYARICAVETPEGTATGLVNSLTMLARVDEYGFICTPYKKVLNRKVLDEIVYLSTFSEADKVIAYYDNNIFEDDSRSSLTYGMINCRRNNEQITVEASEVELLDVSPKQILSVSSSLIPFIENDDTTRAVYGANMQRQALPLIRPTAPLIGTGIEKLVANDSGACLKTLHAGTVKYVSSEQIIIETDSLTHAYSLTKFQKSNDSTLIDHIPRVKIGDYVEAGEIIADASAVDNCEIALGRNVRIAFQSWRGGNYEDAVLISSNLAREFRSVGVTKLEIAAREIKQGIEKFTRDIPSLNREFINHLDDRGIISVGAKVKPGDILVGRVTPKGETNFTPEDRLLRAIFGDKTIDVKDTSLRVPPGMRGTVIDVKILTRKGLDKSPREIEIEQSTLNNYKNEYNTRLNVLRNAFIDRVQQMHPNKVAHNRNINEYLSLNTNETDYINLVKIYKTREEELSADYDTKVKQLLQGHTLPVGVLEMIHVFIATEYQIQPGDKIAGRHGNKGIIAKILSPENMPYTKDGEVVDMLFSCTSISGRMNIGQVLEVHLGWAALHLGRKIDNYLQKIQAEQLKVDELRNFLLAIYNGKDEIAMIQSQSDEDLLAFASNLTGGIPFACPVFESPKSDRIRELLLLAGKDPSGKEELYDGETGLKFPQKVAVGIMYIMQLHHLVEKKEHARSIGPYSLITLQPLGGKSQMGAQRFGEMEVWTLQAYSAAYTTRETLTVKSDYPVGRARIFELISQGYDIFDQNGIPESFCVLLYELRALCLKVDCMLIRDGQLISQDLIGLENFDALKISIASPAQIRAWSYGEVNKSETIHYRTAKPNQDGIFSARIFGPIKDNQCLCGKHRGIKRKGVVCSKCGTEVTSSRVRRYRMGHIELHSPVAHIWFSKILPSRIGTILDMSIADLNRVLRFDGHVVTNASLTPYSVGTVLKDQEYQDAITMYDDLGLELQTGAEALETLLKRIDLESEITKVRAQLSEVNDTAKVKLVKRLKILEAFHKSNSRPEHMILRVLPVMPPDLRPLVAIEGGRFASSDLNELYRRIINRNNRLERLLNFATPEIIIRNEKRMLQEAVDSLFDNSRRAQPVTNTKNKRQLKSIGDIIKGKQGRFRQNLLGKRVDYSGRSVIIVGPHLKLHQCGLPKTMAVELFKPFVLARLILRGFAATIQIAKTLIETGRPEVWDMLAEVTKSHVVLINRAPTLHRLGIQAFEPILIEGRAIQLHPLTCKAFNADFDGDQVGVHVPISIEAQIECRLLMMSTKCILNPSSGLPIATPTKDMVLGLYALTCIEPGFGNEDLVIANPDEAESAVQHNIIRYTTPIRALVDDEIIKTTYGRVKLYSILPKHESLPFALVNKAMTSKDIQDLVQKVFIHFGETETASVLDKLMRIGFEYATLCGATFSYSDLPVPTEKGALLAETESIVKHYYKQYKEGLIREDERHNKITSAWAKCTEAIAERLMARLGEQKIGEMMNPVQMIAVSGARGSPLQLRQLAGMRGLIARFDGSVQEEPIRNSLIEGMTVQECAGSAQGARKGLADTALKTAKSGYLTRIIADTAQDCITHIDDCGTTRFLEVAPLIQFGSTLIKLGNRCYGRTLAADIYDNHNQLIAKAGDIVDHNISSAIDNNEIYSIKVRSPVTCEYNGAGICCKCYGYDLSNLQPVRRHVAVGIIAAQSFGEPATQLTLRNFQSGGAAQNIMSESRIIADYNGHIQMQGIRTTVINGNEIIISKNNRVRIMSKLGQIVSTYRLPHGAKVVVQDGDPVSKGMVIAEWDPYLNPIIAEADGEVVFKDLIPDVSYTEVVDYSIGISRSIVKYSRFAPALVLKTANGNITYTLIPNDAIVIDEGSKVVAGTLLAQRSQNITKTQDIVGGLPLIFDILEARSAKQPAAIAEIDGKVTITHTGSSIKIVTANETSRHEVTISSTSRVLVEDGDTVEAGDLLTDNRPSPHDMLRIKGPELMSRYLTDEIQSVYQGQGITLADKHIEIILRQMLGSVLVVNPGDSTLLKGDVVRAEEIFRINSILQEMGKNKIEFVHHLNGISKAAVLEKTSFFAAASFQETAKRLTTAAVNNEVDCLIGMKECLITGKLIPTGVGGLIREMNMETRKALEKCVLEVAARDMIV